MASLLSLSKSFKLIDYIYPIYFLLAFFELYLGRLGLGTYAKFFAFIILLFSGIKIYKNCPNYLGMKKVFTFFVIYNLFSVIWYIINGISFSCYMNEIFNSIPAMFFFFVGMSEKRTDEKFLKLFLYACTICMLIGFYLYISTPSWFLSVKAEIASNSWHAQYHYSEDYIAETSRFSSYLLDTYEADIYAIFAFAIAMSFLLNKKTYYNQKLSFLFIFVNFAAAILTQQRVAIAAVVCFFLFFIFWGYNNKNKKEISQMLFIVLLLFVLIILYLLKHFGDRMDLITQLLSGRMEEMSISTAMTERNYQLKLLTNHWKNPIFGHGIGAGGASARALGNPGVTDCSYIEMLYEIGILGFIYYFYLIINTIMRGLKYFRYYITELCVIAFVMVACLGSNTLTIGFLAILPFWYCLGRIWNPYLLKYNLLQKIN